MVQPGEAPPETAQPARRPWWHTILQMILFQMVLRYFLGGRRPTDTKIKNPETGEIITIPPLNNSFPPNSIFDVFVHTSHLPFASFDELQQPDYHANLLWTLPDQRYAYEWFRKEDRVNLTLQMPTGSDRYAYHLLVNVVPHEAYEQRNSENPLLSQVKFPHLIVNGTVPLIDFVEPFTEELLSLLDEPREDKREEGGSWFARPAKATEPHFKNRIDIRLVFDQTRHTPSTIQAPQLKRRIKTFPDLGLYHPIVWPTDFWLLEKNFVALNETTREMNLGLTWNIQGNWAFMMVGQMAEMWDPTSPKTGMMAFQKNTRKETFMIKRIILDTNPYFLAFSMAFMCMHSLFSMLAFKNDVQFWHKRDSMEGLSALSVVISFICEIIIGLYLLDSEETSWLILFEILVGCVISGWKLTKAVKVSVTLDFPFIKFSSARNYAESDTQKYDRIAIKWMSVLLLPCTIGYSIYSLKYKKFRSWYSFVINSLAGTVYTFGFVMMTPQLYINYKLKSVDHLPWRALCYKSLNTFVDDIAAFIIDMPWMHRFATFRDDIIFFAYLYQRWIYRVDKKRPSAWVAPAEATEALVGGAAAITGVPSEDVPAEGVPAPEVDVPAEGVPAPEVDVPSEDVPAPAVEDLKKSEDGVRRRLN